MCRISGRPARRFYGDGFRRGIWQCFLQARHSPAGRTMTATHTDGTFNMTNVDPHRQAAQTIRGMVQQLTQDGLL